MSFSTDTKEELCKLKVKDIHHKKALLSGLTQTCATLRIGRVPAVYYQSESESIIKLATMLGSSLYNVEATASRKKQEYRKNPLSIVTFTGPDIRTMLIETGVLQQEGDGLSISKHIPDAAISNPEVRKLFLRGVYLGGGSCSNPRNGYTLEIATRTEGFAHTLVGLLESFSLQPRITERHGMQTVYLRGDDEPGFLSVIGAAHAAFQLEDFRTEREFRSHLNRKNNCETANIGKTVNAGLLQVQAIELIEANARLDSLPAPLYEAAILRMNHPDATLQELADLAGIGKSGMNHRLTRIINIAKEFSK